MTRETATFRAAVMRVAFAILAAALLQLIYPKLADKRVIFIVYALETMLMLALVWKNVAPRVRPIVGGIVDLCFITWIVHRVGSVSTIVVALYVVAATLNGLVVSFRIAGTLAVFAACVYSATLIAEMRGWILHGPDAPAWAPVVEAPDASVVVSATLFIGMFTSISAMLTAKLVQTIRNHEMELEELSHRDPLTQLFNRRHLLSRLEAELARLRRGHPLSVIMIDLDGFKRPESRLGTLTDDVRALVQRADENAYRAKQAGGNRVVFTQDPTA